MEKKELLKEWARHFIRQKDAGKEASVNEDGDKIIANYKDGRAYYFIIPEINNETFMRELNKQDKINIVVLNKASNLEFLIKNWKDFIEFPFLAFHFVNPDSKNDLKWIIRPSVHNRITEPKSLRTGLKAMFDMVDEVR